MKVKIWKRARKVKIGTVIFSSGPPRRFVDDRELPQQFKFPIIWKGKSATLLFDDRKSETARLNRIATHLLAHPEILVYGHVCIVEKTEKRFKMVVKADFDTVRDCIENLGLSAEPILQGLGVYQPATTIYAATEQDLFAIRMCL